MSQDLNRYFQDEAEDLLSRITAALERLRDEPATAEALRELRRWTHTLKGAAQVVRREEIAGAAHRLESMLDRVSESPGKGSALDLALTLTGEMTRAMRGMPSAGPAPAAPPQSPEIETLRVELRELDDLLQAVNESGIVASGLRGLFAPIDRSRDLVAMLRRVIRPGSTEARAQHPEILAEEIGEILADVRRELDAVAEHMQRELDGLRSQAESLRLVRAETILPMLEQSVRAAAAASGKSVEFEASGADLELDAHLLLATRDALIQLTRNAVAHGIESAEERVAAGKPPSGRVQVDFRRDGSRHVLSVADDGRGIDFEGLRRQAIRHGWLTVREARAASTQELTQFLLRPGVTTARSASVLAGRGVGLDLVSSTVARIKGELQISADKGKGTTISIRVPASMNSAALLMVRVSNRVFGLPLDAVRRAASLASLPRLADRPLIDGEALPLVHLAAVFGQKAAPASIAVEIPAHPNSFLLGVDELLGIRQTVIHMLPPYLQAEPWVLGASVESEGQLRLVLDPALLAPVVDELAHSQPPAADKSSAALPILVIDDSLTTRMLEQSIFEMEGYAVDLASSAEEGLEMARQRRYGLFVVDVEMPGVDGFAFVERTQQDAQLRETPAILVTSRGSAEDRARGLKAGAREYMVKSEFDQRTLLNRVRELMRSP